MPLPDIRVTADKLVRGDGDTYGLGDWKVDLTASISDTILTIKGDIVFQENAHDFTTIKGKFEQKITVSILKNCNTCVISLRESSGTVRGENIGARGYKWFTGSGLIKKAFIQTDTFGDDTGNIGGTLRLKPAQIMVDCKFTSAD